MELRIAFRMPKFPMIIALGDALFSADSPEELLEVIAVEIQGVENGESLFIDATGEEFRYFNDSCSLTPTLMRKNWPKKKIIELYNSSINARKSGTSYSEKSLSAKPYRRIFTDIAELIRTNPP